VKQTDLRDMYTEPSRNVATSTTVVSSDHMSPTLSTSTAMKTPDPQSPGPSASLVEN